MENFFDQFDGGGAGSPDVSVTPDGRPKITVRPAPRGADSAIASIESGGRYDLIGPATRNGDRAIGKYQVMGANVPSWTKQYFGQELTPQQFRDNPDAQEAVFKGEFGRLAAKHGPEGAARAWFAGEGGMNDMGRRDVLGTTVADYGRKFTSALGPGTAEAAPRQSGPSGGANFFDQFDGQSDSTMAALSDMTEHPRVRQQVGAGRAAFEGALAGASANFGDEIYGASKASGLPEILGGFRAPVGAARLGYEYLTGQPGEAGKAYDEAVAEKRGIIRDAKEQHPVAFGSGEVGGALASSLVVPGATAATLPGRIGQGAAVGAAYGGLAGAGEGENLADRAVRGATGAVVGGALGGAAPPVVEGVIQAGRAAINPIATAMRGAVNPEAEASRRIVGALERDIRTDPNAAGRLTPKEFGTSLQSGGPARIVDLGGDTTKALARSAANTSPEGRQALNTAINDRYEGQTTRINDWLNSTFHYPSADAQQQAINQVSKTVNRGAYAKAYQAGDKAIWDDSLAALAEDPTVLAAMRRATVSARADEARQGIRPFKQPFDFTGASVTFKRDPNGNTIAPTLQYWDAVKRELDKGGRDSQLFARSLRDHLDTIVPEYKTARAGAAQFFGAENALDAGQNFVRQNFNTAETRRTLAGMSQNERQLFQDGFVSRFVETLNQAGDRRNILNQIAASPAAREKLNIALGPQRATELEAALRVEGIMDAARTAVQGNSTTARQLAELGLAGGAGVTGITGIYNQDPNTMTIGAISAALLAGKRGIDTRVARHVATMLASNDPQVIARGLGIVSRNGRFLDALRSADRRIASVGGVEGSQAALPSLQASGASRADDQPNVPRPPGQ